MKTKVNQTKCNIRIAGHYVSEIASVSAIHSIYHYQVNIEHGDKAQAQTYERELHIRENRQTMVEPDEPHSNDITDEANIKDNKILAPNADLSEITLPIPPANKEESNKSNLINAEYHTPLQEEARKTSTNSTPDESSTASSQQKPIKQSTPGGKQINMLFLFTPVSRLFTKLVTTLKNHLKQLNNKSLRLREIINLPVLKHFLRQYIFSKNPRNIFSTIVFLFCTLTLSGIFLYFYTDSDDVPAETIDKTIPTEPAISQNNMTDYQAVIEKTSEGVVITLQGPDHEEVLTKLPPGYFPVVEDDKIVHIVTPGNTLWFIAKRYIKNPYRYPELAKLNKIKNPDLIYPGNKVIIQYIRKP